MPSVRTLKILTLGYIDFNVERMVLIEITFSQ